MYREGQVGLDGHTVYVNRILLDTGASRASYVGRAIVDRLPNVVLEPCSHKVLLGDGITEIELTECVTLDVSLYNEDLGLCESIATEFYVMPNLGEEIIVGLPEILGNYYEYFVDVLERARRTERQEGVLRLHQLYGLVRDQLCRPDRSNRKLKAYASEAKTIRSGYVRHKNRIKSSLHREVIRTNEEGKAFSLLVSERHGTAYADNRVEHLAEIIQDFRDYPIDELVDAWSQPPEMCPEEEETPDPLAMGPDVLKYMEMTNEEARAEYLDLLEKQISPAMRAAVPRVVDIMKSPAALETFSPSAWNGLKVPPINFETNPGMPAKIEF